MCPRKFTLRKLKWMADSKREHDYDTMISVACWVGQVFDNKFVPSSANPVRNQHTEALIESNDPRGSDAFFLLGAALGQMVGSVPDASNIKQSDQGG